MRRDVRQRRFVLAHLGITWLVLAAADTGLLIFVRGTSFGEARLPLTARASLIATELALLALSVAATFGPLALVLERAFPGDGAGANRPRAGFLGRAARVLACALVAWVLLFLFGASWSLFRSTGHFLDREALALWSANRVQLLQHVQQMEPGVLLAVPLVVLCAALVVAWLLPRWLSRQPGQRLDRLALVAGLVASACAALAVAGQAAHGADKAVVADASTGATLALGQLHGASRDRSSGPAAHFAAELRAGFSAGWAARGGEVALVRRRAVPLETWAAGVDGASVRPLNVLVILVDSLRPDQLESGSAKRSIMPNLDALARRSRVFTDTLCQASNSAYADPCVLSSHYPLRSQGVYRYEPGMTAPRVLFYDVLSQLGWTTGIFSSQNEYWEGMIHYLDTGHVDRFVHAENFAGPTYMQGTDVAFEDWAKVRKRAGKIEDKYTIGELIGWIDEVRGNPFCAYVNLQNSHSPFELPPGATRRFGPEKLDFTVNFAAFPVEKVPVVLDLYADCLSYVDEQLGRLFDHLTEAGLLESTIVIVSGDTGQAFHEHGFAGHGNALYDEVMRVPLVLWAPGLAPGLDDRPAQHVDVPPTVNALLGLPPHPAWQGLSLVDADTHPDRSRFLVVQTPFAHQFAVVRSGFKLIYDARSNRALLYDRRNDPGETRDVSAEHPELTQELSARLAAWYRTQIEYNADTALHAREYPPVLIE